MRYFVFLTVGLLLSCPTRNWAQDKTVHLIVSAGADDHLYEPAAVPLSGISPQETVATLKDDLGHALPCQLTGPSLQISRADGAPAELHFVIPKLKAKTKREFTLVLSKGQPKSQEGDFAWHEKSLEFSELRQGALPVLRYINAPLDEKTKESRDRTFKVFHHVFDPSGKRIVTNGPAGLYPHHRGLFYGFNRISYGQDQKADVWHCTGDAHQSHEKTLSQEAGPVLGRHRLLVNWHGPAKGIFAEEERELTAYAVPGGRLIEFASVLKSKAGTVKLDGDPQHAGFHFRADKEVAEKHTQETYFLRPDGPGKPGETRNWDPKTRKGPVNMPWDAMSFVLGDRRYTVAYLDRPTNPKESRNSEREYGRIGSYFEYMLDEAHPVTLVYRVWLQNGEMTVKEVEQLSRQFTKPAEIVVK